MTGTLETRGLCAKIKDKPILKGLDLTVKPGEVHAIMGPNGSGKSTLAHVLLGHPRYEVTAGEMTYDGKNMLEMKPDERARAGLFLSFQYPFEIQGLGFSKFLLQAYKATHPDEKVSVLEFRKRVTETLKKLEMKESMAKRELNVGFSGGEKKRAEILQLLTLKPKLAILDETDSGLDVDSLRLVATTVNGLKGPAFSAVVITHYSRILDYLKPDKVHVLVDGKIIASGGPDLAARIEKEGYAPLLAEKGLSTDLAKEETEKVSA